MIRVAAALMLAAQATPPTPLPAPAAHDAHAGMNHGDMTAPRVAQIMPGYGGGGFAITTTVPRAQGFFTNGMQLAHAFAHKAAIAAMAEAVHADPACAMCLWGLGWASGPTINYTRSRAELKPLAADADRAARLAAANGTDRERALIDALRRRYRHGGGGKPGDLDFARAMAALVERYPHDDEIAVIAADARLMAPAGSRADEIRNAQAAMPLLEAVLARDPDYSPAIHFYIHATEIAGVAGRAERYADRLAALAPRASHLVHMPSHTYYWVGRYQDAANANVQAVAIGVENARALGLPPPDGVWGLPYHWHNVTYGLGGALEAGDAVTALSLGRPLVERSQKETAAEPFEQLIAANGYFALARFAAPAEVLALPSPKLPILIAAWHYARGEAQARAGDAAAVRREAAAIPPALAGKARGDGTAQARLFVAIARDVLAGRAATIEGHHADAAAAYRAAAVRQESADFSVLSDPPAWYYPIRRDVAAALLADGDRAGARREAEAALAYRVKDPATLALIARM